MIRNVRGGGDNRYNRLMGFLIYDSLWQGYASCGEGNVQIREIRR